MNEHVEMPQLDSQLYTHYENAKARFEEYIKPCLNYRYDLPLEKVELDDPDYNIFMCRNNVIDVVITHADLFLNLDAKYLPHIDESRVSLIRKYSEFLHEICQETIKRKKTEDEMDEIKFLVKGIVDNCQGVLDMNKPSEEGVSVAA